MISGIFVIEGITAFKCYFEVNITHD